MSAAASYWRVAGISYLQYVNISANVVRNALKEPLKTEALKRASVQFNISQWADGKQHDSGKHPHASCLQKFSKIYGLVPYYRGYRRLQSCFSFRSRKINMFCWFPWHASPSAFFLACPASMVGVACIDKVIFVEHKTEFCNSVGFCSIDDINTKLMNSNTFFSPWWHFHVYNALVCACTCKSFCGATNILSIPFCISTLPYPGRYIFLV